MARILAISEYKLDELSRAGYIAGTAEKRARAKESDASFWVFEHLGEQNRFVEFLEGDSESSVRKLLSSDANTSIWRALEEV